MRRSWTNPAHRQAPAWYLFICGSLASVGVLACAELLLIVAEAVKASA